MYRGTQSTGDQWQQCWDSTQNIIEKCVNEGPNVGWVNGPNPYQVTRSQYWIDGLISFVLRKLRRSLANVL